MEPTPTREDPLLRLSPASRAIIEDHNKQLEELYAMSNKEVEKLYKKQVREKQKKQKEALQRALGKR